MWLVSTLTVGVFGAGLDALVAVDAVCRRCLDQGGNGNGGKGTEEADVVRQGGSGGSGRGTLGGSGGGTLEHDAVDVVGGGTIEPDGIDVVAGGTLEHDAVDVVGGGTTTGRGAVDAATGVDAVDFVGG